MAYAGYAHLDASTGSVTGAELAYGATSVLGYVNGVNLKNTGHTKLLTTSGAIGGMFITDVVVSLDSASAITVAPIIRIGLDPNYTEYCGLTTLGSFTTQYTYFQLSKGISNNVHTIIPPSHDLYLDVNTGATATTMTASFYVIGYVI